MTAPHQKRPPADQNELLAEVPFVSVPTSAFLRAVSILGAPGTLSEISAMDLIALVRELHQCVDVAWEQALAKKITDHESNKGRMN